MIAELDKVARCHRVTVPGLPNVDRLLPTRVPGLLFADDLVVLAETPEDMEISLNIISEWAEKFEMSVNAGKCGTMAIKTEKNFHLRFKNILFQSLRDIRIWD
ncbi:hypothetical protein AX774_g2288 [Zancudomyces culisetae]|uniref:Reverse transcriptase domain-containing protein n=1 Tax=Zancudomyces culisetae TaxID=1213189 RepID=A0A1R1PTC0_ZANCU|nr:hypothetical protein AX774_g2288 [Zancudomyces culisetae]|eukprot:OMH84197.1 hypothetical protein AX774_g2288 [Zancudomyces culisetae]